MHTRLIMYCNQYYFFNFYIYCSNRPFPGDLGVQQIAEAMNVKTALRMISAISLFIVINSV